MNNTNIPQVNDILLSTWGYDQTNSDYYKVLKVVGTFVELVALNEVETPHKEGWMFGTTLPLVDSIKGLPFRKKYKDGYGGGYRVKINSFAGASVWDGTPTEVSHTH